MSNQVSTTDYHSLNAMVDIYATDEHGNKRIQIEKDKEAVRQYFLQHVNQNTVFFHSLEEKLDYLISNGYYESEFFDNYEKTFVKKLYRRAYGKKFRFETFIGAYKFYTTYALKTFESSGENVRYLERWEDRVTVVALYLAHGDTSLAENLVDEMIGGRVQPATPTFQNAGRKSGGKLVSCFLLHVDDSIEGLTRSWASGAQLSKDGGGVGYCLTDIRPAGDTLKGMKGLSKGVIPWMKVYEDTFSAVDQLGQRPGAAAVYLHANHMDIMAFLDCKRENADEKVRIKTLSLGVVIPDILFELAKNNEEMYTFSSYDVEKFYGIEFSRLGVSKHYREMVENPAIRKGKVSARKFLQTLAELQFESGYPYIMFEDTVNEANPIEGYISMSNLCSEILEIQTPSKMNSDLSYSEVGRDISCNLASMNVAKALDGKNIAHTVETAVRALTQVSDMTSVEAVPSVKKGNQYSHSIGLGQMNLHGFFAREHMHYGDEDSLDFTNNYFLTVAYHALRTSNQIAIERNETFVDFEKSTYADGSYFHKYVNELGDKWQPKTEKVKGLFKKFHVTVPSRQDWIDLQQSIIKHGIYNAYLQAIPPTGSISYINNATASVHPIVSSNGIEKRNEGQVGRVIAPAYALSDDTAPYYEKNAYDLMPETIAIYAAAQQHVDQGMSLTVFARSTQTTKDLTKNLMLAWRSKIKTLYYTRVAGDSITGTTDEGCVSCAL